MELAYRKVEFNEEIIQLLQTYVQNKWTLLLWQSHERNSARHVHVLSVNAPRKQIQVSFNGPSPKLDAAKNIYCHGEEKKLVFKTLSVDTGVNPTLQIQEELRLVELRKNARFDMFANKNAFMTLMVLSHYESKETSFVLKMNDISVLGASVITHSRNLMHFTVGQQVKVTQIGSDVANFPIDAEVMHIMPIRPNPGKTEVQLYKVGLRFTKKINFYSFFLTRHLEW